jgi:anti-sigma factor RsiW
MKAHVTEWLGAYLDGELSGRRLNQVESHLAECTFCRGELEHLRSLGALLREAPGAEGSLSGERFVSRVGLRLPRRQVRPPAQRALELGWKMVPAGLLFSLAFVQSVFFVAGAVQAALRLGWGGELAAMLLPGFSGGWSPPDLSTLSQASVGGAFGTVSALVQSGSELAWLPVLYLCLSSVIGLLYCSWLASWWARRRHQQLTISNHTA